jgi:hypothetical protein
VLEATERKKGGSRTRFSSKALATWDRAETPYNRVWLISDACTRRACTVEISVQHFQSSRKGILSNRSSSAASSSDGIPVETIESSFSMSSSSSRSTIAEFQIPEGAYIMSQYSRVVDAHAKQKHEITKTRDQRNKQQSTSYLSLPLRPHPNRTLP